MSRVDHTKLMELCHKRRDRKNNVTLSWPQMLQIIDQLRHSNALVTRLRHIDGEADLHPHQQWDEAKEALAQHLNQTDHFAGASKKAGQS